MARKTVTNPETTTPITTAEESIAAAGSAKAPLEAPASGPLKEGFFYTATFPAGQAVKFLWQTNGVGFIETPLALYAHYALRYSGVWQEAQAHAGTYDVWPVLYVVTEAGQKVIVRCEGNPAVVGKVMP